MEKGTLVYDLKELAEKLNISVGTLREYIKRKDPTASKIGKAYYVTEPNLLSFIESNRKC